MSNRAWIGAGVIAMLIGCRATGHPGPSRTEARSSLDEAAAPGSPPPRDGGTAFAAAGEPTGGGAGATASTENDAVECPAPCPDPPNCTCGNGTGIYAAEGGFAGITVQMALENRVVSRPIMITHFINNGSGLSGNVTFHYGYFDPYTNQWKSPGIGTGRIDSADYGPQKDLRVISIHETSTPTMPVWELLDPASKAPVQVKDLQMTALSLYISFTVSESPSGSLVPKKALLSFNAASKFARTGGGDIYVYSMQWKNLSDPSITSTQQYCRGPSQQPDTVVFQQGIDVDPVKGTVTRPGAAASLVTLSCSLGAPAKVYSWGYSYQGSSPSATLFDAGIHMKRASYCADFRHYTWADTDIFKSDDQNINHLINPPPPSAPPGIEAWWGPGGALCVNSENMRHLSLAPANDVSLMSCGGKPYTSGQPLQDCSFVCNGKLLPRCPQSPLPQPWPPFLADGPVKLNQP